MKPGQSVVIEHARELRGTIRVPGDKSITHRALFFAALNAATTTITNASPAEDCGHTSEIIRAIGCNVDVHENQIITRRVRSVESNAHLHLYCGNSGTTARIAMGLLAAEPGRFTLTGDASLMRRPMDRVFAPLRVLGATISTGGDHLPATIEGTTSLAGGTSHGVISVVSAQVHAALVLAALRSLGGASLFVAHPMRDHTRRMLAHFGVATGALRDGVERILPATIDRVVHVDVPGDFSSAAFFLTAAILTADSAITIEGVGLNPTRTAYLRALERMGAQIEIEMASTDFEPRGRVTARYSGSLRAADFGDELDIDVPVAEMIDELPLLALVATQADGITRIRNVSELRVKESDRITATIDVLRSLGANLSTSGDELSITGPVRLVGNTAIDSAGDHRLVMMAAVGALIADGPSTIRNADVASVSNPRYWEDLRRIGATVQAI